jgi:hypothetical protein
MVPSVGMEKTPAILSRQASPGYWPFSKYCFVLNKVYTFWLLIRKVQWIRAQNAVSEITH